MAAVSSTLREDCPKRDKKGNKRNTTEKNETQGREARPAGQPGTRTHSHPDFSRRKRRFVPPAGAGFLLTRSKQTLPAERTEANAATGGSYRVCSVQTATHLIRLILQLLPSNRSKSHVFFHNTYLWEHYPSVQNKALSRLTGRFQANKNSHLISSYYLHLFPQIRL